MDDIRKKVYLFDITEQYKYNSLNILDKELVFLEQAILNNIKILFIVHHRISQEEKEQLIRQIPLPYEKYFDFNYEIIGIKYFPKTFEDIKETYNILAVFDTNDYVVNHCKSQHIFACKI